ncbi:hypothetical protein ACS0PU_006247 [Formica fusca]
MQSRIINFASNLKG